MSYTEERELFFENYQKLKKQNPDVNIKDCMPENMLSDLELEKSYLIRSKKTEYEHKKFNYESLIENKELSKLAETEFEFRYPNYLFHYDFEFADTKLQSAIVTFLNDKLPSLWDEDPFTKIVTLHDLTVDETRIVIYEDHREILIVSEYYEISVRLIIKDNQACLLEY